jgi:hypothetical protein
MTLSPPAKTLAAIIDSSQPETLLCCGETAGKVGQVWLNQKPEHRQLTLDSSDPNTGLPPEVVPDLAIITETLEDLSHEQGTLLLGQLRNFGTQRIAVLVSESSGWHFNDFIGLGFQRHGKVEQDDQTLTLFTYNLDSYNHKRTWNNPDYWANPEMWGKAWW